MSTKVEKRILVNVPLSVAYNQWTQFEEFPHFMSGIKSVTQLDDQHLEWVAEIAGVRRQWKARIVEQVPDKKVSWAATEGATNAGSVTFEDVGGGQTQVHLVLEYEPEGLVEKIGDKLNVVENRAEGDLDRFKAFIESEGYATGAWRGAVGTGTAAGEPGIEAAAASRGDSGKAGISGKVAAGVGIAAAGAAAAAAVAASKQNRDDAADVTVTPATRDERSQTWDAWSYRDTARPAQGSRSLVGYEVTARDGDIGKIDEASDEVGTSRLVVDTGPWILGRKVILPAGTIDRVDDANRKVYVDLTKDQIKNSPEWDQDTAFDGDYQGRLGNYYDEFYR
ncbi:SRPBCC family protein [Microbacterium sp. CFBP9034]|uniref:SRPBCC family protein n=1 Tax=Microbacterium sp. CFBP9034 TaxID=3096540 RepID=UPI002A6B7226|nr:SRPBCC family protein [Microbacterium sp. CFBP9034]MDY0910889.1 SRPBCC family protein [Microbacterium sp. CFBP9034]